MTNIADIPSFLLAHGIKPSAQRIAVARYLSQHLTHPTVDEIYNDLLADYPTLSRTTVYNTVKLLTENGCIAWLDVDAQGARFDFNTAPHAHFACCVCGQIIDIPICGNPHAPEGFKVNTMQLNYKGVCPSCASKSDF